MSAPAHRRPAEIASRLGVSVSTLRRWSQQFSAYLSEVAQSSDDDSARHRRYTDEDLGTLITIKGLLTEGYTYSQARRRLQVIQVDPTPEGEPYALVPSDEPTRMMTPAVSVLSDTLHTVADGQQLLLNSQQVNRDLLSVTIQDNFNLKSENAKLRDRMLDLERSLSEVKRQEASAREALESRLRAVEDTLDALVEQTADYEEEPRGGVWSRLFGR
ncbi:MAG TPA: MerR family transcriptional regulator [Anaerolineae bacterium]|jgi:DNA-binding transcriptional MerR regulator|nr:MerR family transcriptional regulator [Anaerolineae bacterium]